MLWPLILPLTITVCLMGALIVVSTAIAPYWKWNRRKTLLVAASLALLAFVPTFAGIMHVVDGVRFGRFEYATFRDVNDVRAQRYLPTTATNITMHKQANGYRARYSISDADFHAYLDRLWHDGGKHSVVKRGELHGDGLPTAPAELERVFSDLGWKALQEAIQYSSPREADGGGATYYFDREAGDAYQRTGYW